MTQNVIYLGELEKNVYHPVVGYSASAHRSQLTDGVEFSYILTSFSA